MENTKQIATIQIVGSNVMEIQSALTKMIAAARMASNGVNFGGSSCIDVENQDGIEVAHIDLIEETLTDQSKVYNVRLRFSNVE